MRERATKDLSGRIKLQKAWKLEIYGSDNECHMQCKSDIKEVKRKIFAIFCIKERKREKCLSDFTLKKERNEEKRL